MNSVGHLISSAGVTYGLDARAMSLVQGLLGGLRTGWILFFRDRNLKISEKGSELYPGKALLNIFITGLKANKEGMFTIFVDRVGDKDMTRVRIGIQINLTHRREAMG